MKKITVLLLPFVIWAILFTVFEPVDYWGLKGKSYEDFEGTDPLARMKLWNRSDSRNLILGDSRIAGLYRNYSDYELRTGQKVDYEILGFAGASAVSNRDLFWYAVEKRKPEKVIFQLSFWMVGKGQSRIDPYFQYEKNPASYYLSRNYNLDAYHNMINFFMQASEDDTTAKNEPEPDYAQIRLDEAAYIRNMCENYAISEDIMEDLIKIADYCADNEIEFYFVMPPLHEVIWEEVIEKMGFEPAVEEYKRILSDHAQVIDMEYKSELIYSEDFTDGIHFRSDVYKEWMGTLLKNPEDMKHCRIWEKGKVR